MNKELKYISIISHNTSGVLERITAVFRRKLVNLESVSVVNINDKNISHFTIGVDVDDSQLNKLCENVHKLVDVSEVRRASVDTDYIVSTLICSVKNDSAVRKWQDYLSTQKECVRILEEHQDYLGLSVTGTPEQIKLLYSSMQQYDVTLIKSIQSGATVFTPVT